MNPERSRRGLAIAVALAALALVATFAAWRMKPGSMPIFRASSSAAATSTASVEETSTGPVEKPLPSPGAVPLQNLKISLAVKWTGFAQPVYITNAGDGSGRLFVVERAGRIKVIGRNGVQATPYLDIHSLVSSGADRGLLGIAFSPRFATDGKLYVNYTDLTGNTVIACYTSPVPGSSVPRWRAPVRLMSIPQPYSTNNGGCMQFGRDSYLYIAMGDGGGNGDPGNRAQNPKVLLGKILRIDVSRASAGKPYNIPPTNPYNLTTKVAQKPAPEVWATGLRNPWRFSFDTDGSLWVGDDGQGQWQEVDFVTKTAVLAGDSHGGLNFGWKLFEGFHYYPGNGLVPAESQTAAYVWPIYEYGRPAGGTVVGGYVYRGNTYPAMRGVYFFADAAKGWIAGIRTTSPSGIPLATRQESQLVTSVLKPTSFGVSQSGDLYIVDSSGSIFELEAK